MPIVAVLGILVAIAYLARHELNSERFQRLHDSGIDAMAINLMVHSPAAEEALGKPVRRVGLPKGEALMPKEGGYAQAVLPMTGSKDTGKLCIVGNRTEDGWDVEAAQLILGGGRGTIDLTPPVTNEEVEVPSFGTVFLIPLSRSVAKLLDSLPAYYRAKLGIEVKVLPVVTPGDGVMDKADHELVAEKLMVFMRHAYPELVADPTTTLIGVTDADMEDRSLGWDHTLNLREDGRFGVISTRPLEPRGTLQTENPLVFPVRLRKIVTKNIGLLDFPLTLSADATSVLAANNGQPSAVDLMGENFRNAAGEWVPGSGDLDANVSITRKADGSVTWRIGSIRTPRIGTESQLWENDLSVGLFLQEQTDFYYTEPFPVRFVRAYRPHDNLSGAFGTGAGDSFDPYLVGVYGSWCDLVLDDGSRIHYERDRGRPFSEDYDAGSGWIYPFGDTVLRYNGGFWTLQRDDGWTMTFPNSYSSYRRQQGAMTGLYDNHGHRFQLVRDGEGNLLQLKTPEGNRIDFQYDSAGRVIRAADNHGRRVEYAYDKEGRLVSVKDSTGQTEQYFYDDRNDMTRIEDGAGHVLLTNEYDQAGCVVRQQLADGRVFRYKYQQNASGKVEAAAFIDPRGDTFLYHFGSRGYWESWPKEGNIMGHRDPGKVDR